MKNNQHVLIQHRTAYYFDRPTVIMPHIVRLRPAPHCRAPIHSYQLTVTPKQHYIHWQQDPFANYLARLVFTEEANELIFDVNIVANMKEINPLDFFIENYAENFPFNYDDQLKEDLTSYLQVKEFGPQLRTWIESIDLTPRSTIDFLVMLNTQVYQNLKYQIRLEGGVQSCEESLHKLSGSCRDSAWLLIQILRKLGLAARFVSGYQVQMPSQEKMAKQPNDKHSKNTQSNDLHAWAEVYIPGAGWIGLDPSSGLFAATGYIPLACTPDPSTAAPISGTTSLCEVKFEHSNQVSLIEI